MEITYRKLTADDMEMVMAMNRNYREGFIQAESARQFLSRDENWLFAAIRDGVIIGFAYGYALNRLDRREDMLYIHEVGVMEAHQRQDVGYQRMTALKAACKARHLCRYFLSTYQSNTGANALYKKLGGDPSPESKGQDTNYYFQIQ